MIMINTRKPQRDINLLRKVKILSQVVKPANNFGLGPGIAKPDLGFLERYRAGADEDYGKDHVNLEIYNPLDILEKKKRIKPLINIHLNINDD